MSGFGRFLFGGEVSGTPTETRGGTELLASIFEDVLRTGDFGRLGSQGFGFAAFPGGGASALPGRSPGAFGGGGGLRRTDPVLIKGEGFRGPQPPDPDARRARRKGGSESRGGLDPESVIAVASLLRSLPEFQAGGFLPRRRTGIVGEAGPELITATDTGTAITPLTEAFVAPADPTQFTLDGGGGRRRARPGGGGTDGGTRTPGIAPPEGSPLGPGGGSIPSGTQPGGGIPTSDPNRGPAGIPGGPGGIVLPPAPTVSTPVEQAVLDILAGGGPLIPGEGQEALSMFLGEGGAAGLPPEAQEALTQLLGGGAIPAGAQDIISGIRGRPLIPGEAGGLLETIQGEAISPQAQDIISRIQGGELVPEEARGILSTLQEGGPALPAETQAALSRLLGMTGAGVPAGAQDLVSALTGDPAALNQALFASLEPFEQRQTEQQVAQLREGFSGAGGRFGTGLVGAETQLRGELANQFERARQEALLQTLGIQAQFLPTLFESARTREATQAGLVGEQIRAGTAGAQTSADVLASLLGRAGQREAVGADVLSSVLGAETARAGTSADALASILGAAGQRAGTEADVLSSILGAETAGARTRADVIGQLLGTETAQRGQTGDLLRSLIGAETERFGTVADFIPRQQGALTQAQLASLEPIRLLAQFFSPGQPGVQQGAIGDIAALAAALFA